MTNFGAKKGFGGGFSAPRQTVTNDNEPLVADSTAQGDVRYVIPGTSDPVSPIASDMYNKGGVYVGKSSLDKWRFSLNAKKQIVVFGDSTAQGSVGGYDGWPERLSRLLGNKMGPRVTTGAGFYGLYRSGSSLSSTNSDSDWTGYGVWATTLYSAAYDLAPLFGTYTALNASVTAVRTYADTVTTINSRSVTSAAAAVWVAGDVGALITGTNIPPNTYITSRISNTSITISQPAYATGAGLTSTTHGTTLTWTRPISSNIRAQLCWASATTNLSPTITTLNANYGSGTNGSHLNAMITGTNIPAYTTISSWNSYTSVTLSKNCTATTTGYTGYNIVHDGRTVSDLATTNASAVITSATANFTSADVSSKVVGENIPAGTYILSVESPTSATISANATATASAKFLFVQNENAARYVDDLVTTASSPTITSASAAFTQEDVGRQVTGTNIPNNTVISSVTNNTTAVLTNNIAYSSTLGFLGIAATSSTDVAQVDLITCNGVTNNGANYTYSTDGGNTWVAVTQTAAAPVHLLSTSVYSVNPNTVIVRANTSAGAKSQLIFYGLFAYQQANASSGVCLYNIARDGWTLSQTGLSWGGDEMSFFDNSLANSATSTAWHGLFPDLFIVMYTNDAFSAVGGRQHWWNAINRTISRVNSYADILFISAFDQGLPRDSDTQRQFAKILKEAALSTSQTYWYADDGVGDGTTSFTSASIEFVKSDIGKTITGTGIPTGTTIVSLTSADVAVLSNVVPISSNVPFRILGNTPDAPAAVLDLYEAWAADGYRGFVPNGTATGSSQRLQEFLHESQLGHNDIARRVAVILEGY
jgi:hypothetical protein